MNIRDRFFEQPEWNRILCGQGDFRTMLSELFEKHRLTIDVDAFIEYWLTKDLNWNVDVLKFAEELKYSGHVLHIATNQDRIRGRHIREHVKIKRLFTEVITSADVGINKPSIEFFQKLRERLLKNSSGTPVLIDDDQRNIGTAHAAGFKGIYFNPDLDPNASIESLDTALNTLLAGQ